MLLIDYWPVLGTLNNLGVEDEMADHSRMAPWWLLGLDGLVVLLFGVLIYGNIESVYVYVVIGIAAIRFSGAVFVLYSQRAKFSIKNILTLTFGVAVLCSIFVYQGLVGVFVTLILTDLVVTFIVAADRDMVDIAHRHSWHRSSTISSNSSERAGPASPGNPRDEESNADGCPGPSTYYNPPGEESNPAKRGEKRE